MEPTANPATLRIDVWSDYVCPFCMLEMPVLDALAAEYGDALRIEWRAFELRPEPEPTLDPSGEYLRTTWARAVYPMAEARGLALRLPPVQPRSAPAHAADYEARRQGRGEAMRRALFSAFFEQGRDIGDVGVLLDIAAGAGVDASALRTALERGVHDSALREDREDAAELGIQGVPALLIRRAGDDADQGILVSGAHPLDVLRRAIDALADVA